MNYTDNTKKLLINYASKYPKLEIRDIFKFLHQSALGCEHLVSSYERAVDYIKREAESLLDCGSTVVEPLDGSYSRVNLSALSHGLSPETLGRLFFLSAKKEEQGIEALNAKLAVAEALILNGELPFSYDEFVAARDEWKGKGYPAIHHSDTFRSNYSPAYRVISNEFVQYLPLFIEIDKRNSGVSLTVAIDGGSASGKTTLAQILSQVYECTVFHMDDFFLRPEQRTPERFAQIGGNVDRERFLSEVLIPMKNGETIIYRKFDCETFSLSQPTEVIPKRMTVIEGVYSMHYELSQYYDMTVFLDVSPEVQLERIRNRNSEKVAERFFNEWIPLEHVYFDGMKVKERCDVCIGVR